MDDQRMLDRNQWLPPEAPERGLLNRDTSAAFPPPLGFAPAQKVSACGNKLFSPRVVLTVDEGKTVQQVAQYYPWFAPLLKKLLIGVSVELTLE